MGKRKTTEKIGRADKLAALLSHGALTAVEMADRLGVRRQSVYATLHKLREHGHEVVRSFARPVRYWIEVGK